MNSPSFHWTRIDPAIHTPEWFRGKGVTFRSRDLTWSRDVSEAIDDHLFEDADHFIIHPPLPDPLEEEIEREAKKDAEKEHCEGECSREYHYLRGVVAKAYARGARAFLGRKG